MQAYRPMIQINKILSQQETNKQDITAIDVAVKAKNTLLQYAIFGEDEAVTVNAVPKQSAMEETWQDAYYRSLHDMKQWITWLQKDAESEKLESYRAREERRTSDKLAVGSEKEYAMSLTKGRNTIYLK